MTETWLLLAQLALVGVGHAVIWTYLLNNLYGRKLSKLFLKPWRLLTFVIIVFGWPIYLAMKLDAWPSLTMTSLAILKGPLWWYAWICLALGSGFVALTVLRLFRKRPDCLVDEKTTTIDYFSMHGRDIYGRGKWWWLARLPFNDIFKVEFIERTIRVTGVPREWDGVTLLHLTDFHFHGTPSRLFFEKVFEDVRSRWPENDLICLTGDFLDTDRHVDWITPFFSEFHSELKFALLGNHDQHHHPERIREALAAAGYDVLGNRRTRVMLRGIPLDVVGHEGPWFTPPPESKKSDVPTLCLSHSPDNVFWAADQGCFLTLAGHVHGGQIRIPIIGSIFVPSTFSRRFDGDVYQEQGMPMNVSRGLSGKEPIRFRCPPQVMRITLKVAQAPRPE